MRIFFFSSAIIFEKILYPFPNFEGNTKITPNSPDKVGLGGIIVCDRISAKPFRLRSTPQQKWMPTPFPASVSDSVNVEMEKVSGALWPEIKVYGPDGVMLCEAFSVGTAKILNCSLTSNGTYPIHQQMCPLRITASIVSIQIIVSKG